MYFEIAFTVFAAICIIALIVDKIREHKNRRRRRLNRSSVTSNNRTATGTGTATQTTTVISETGPIIYYANDSHNSTDKQYKFNYKNIGGNYRAYILRTPSFGARDQSGVVTHRLWDNENKPYVCWDRNIKNLKDMQTVSKVWADSIQEYIATGKKFGPGN